MQQVSDTPRALEHTSVNGPAADATSYGQTDCLFAKNLLDCVSSVFLACTR